MIPELIHFIWFPPSPNESEPPEDVRGNILEWQRLHSGFQIKIWGYDDLESLHVLKDIGIWNHLSSCRFEAMKSDIVRLAIAYEHGSFYNDLKNRPMLPFLGELVPLEEIVLVEVPPYIPNFKDLISNSFFAGPPKHEFFLKCLKRIQHKI
jgi:mannosyltransferase OCH1-like enzyme